MRIPLHLREHHGNAQSCHGKFVLMYLSIRLQTKHWHASVHTTVTDTASEQNAYLLRESSGLHYQTH